MKVSGQWDEMLSTPVMTGDVLAVRKSFLTAIGDVDEHFHGTNGHRLELSLRAWLCGGKVSKGVPE